MRVEYSSNNSGGSWWLKDADWKALEDAGWVVEWGKLDFCHSKYRLSIVGESVAPNTCAVEMRTNPNGREFEYNTCKGHRHAASYAEMVESGARWLGALATAAHKDFPTLADAVREWEQVTGQDASDNGCGCCGPPHSFSSDDGYASGDDIAGVLYPEAAGLSAREMAKRLASTPTRPEGQERDQ